MPPHDPRSDASAETLATCARAFRCDRCFESLVRQFQSPLLHYLRRRVGSVQLAEDLLQETFLAAYRHLNRYQPTQRFSTWIFTIAHRLAISEFRKRRPERSSSIEQAASDSDPAIQAQRRELSNQLWDEIDQAVEADAAAALWLSYVESMSADEVGQVIGRSANAVRILLHRSRQKLSQTLRPFSDQPMGGRIT